MFPIKDNVPTRHFPVVTGGLIVANVLIFFLYQAADVEASAASLALHPCEIVNRCDTVGEDWPLTSVTSMFLHGDLLHLGGNMLFLWIFGNNIEDALGHVRFFIFYVLGGFAATALQAAITLGLGTDAEARIPNLGASGAISAVLGGYLLLLPGAKVVTLIFLIIILIRELPAWIFLGVWFAFQLWDGGYSLLHPQEGGGVAFFAHIGGFAFGMAAIYLFAVRRPLRPAY